MKRFVADLHVHTALSPCAADDMAPPEIVKAARSKGLDVIAICDHNTARNVAATQKAAGQQLRVIAGIEVTTREEAHVVGLFPDAARATTVAEQIGATLPVASEEAKARFGRQWLLDAEGCRMGEASQLLAAASAFSLSETVELIKAHQGLAIAAHVDRPSFSVLSQLGVFPTDVAFDAAEVSPVGLASGRHQDLASLGLPVIASSDSHFLWEVGCGSTVFEMLQPSFEEIAGALRGLSGRRCLLA